MGKSYTFNQTVRGYSHIDKDIVCQDYSGVFQNEEFEIAVVSDGHGDPSCFRSDVGSKKAVDISLTNLQNFARNVMDDSSLYESLKIEEQRVKIIRKLTNGIIKKWVEVITTDCDENPPTEEDYAKCKSYADSYRQGKKIAHIYGATLIIAVRIKDLLILIQQGDGGCTVFLEDGSVIHPIPEDKNCHANVTTSLCDENAKAAIRHSILEVSKHKPIACFLGSDGVEDSYTDDEGNTIFYKELMIDYFNEYNKNHEKFIKSLQEYLPSFSETGSGDDVSVAGILSLDKMELAVKRYPDEINHYRYLQEFNYYTQKVNSMKRKHDFLEEKFNTLTEECKPILEELTQNKELIESLTNNTSSAISVSEQTTVELSKLIELRNETEEELLKVKKDITKNNFDEARAISERTILLDKIQEAN